MCKPWNQRRTIYTRLGYLSSLYYTSRHSISQTHCCFQRSPTSHIPFYPYPSTGPPYHPLPYLRLFPSKTRRPLNSADRLFHSVDLVQRSRRQPPQVTLASIVDRIDVARNFLAALPSWISTFFGPAALAAWITPTYAVESIAYTFLRDDSNRWNGSWESPHDQQVRADLLLPFATNLPIHIENMSLVTATQARNPFERHVKFNPGVISLGPQSTTTSPGHAQKSHTADSTTPLVPPQHHSTNSGSDHSSTLPDAVTAAGAPTNALITSPVDSINTAPTTAHPHSSNSSSTEMPDLDDPGPDDSPQVPSPHHLNPSDINISTAESQHSDVIHDLDSSPQTDPTSAQDSQASPLTAAGAPSIASQWDDLSQSEVTARGAPSIHHDSPTNPSMEIPQDDLTSSTNRSSKRSGDCLELPNPPLRRSPRT